MSLPEPMVAAARRAMIAALDLSDSDGVRVLGDDTVGRCAEAFAAAAEAHGCSVVTASLPDATRPLTSLPGHLCDLLAPPTTVVINTLDGRSDEVPFRIEWIKAIEDTGRIRMGHCPGITTEMIVDTQGVGTYPVICAELCGAGHGIMRTRVIVMEQSDYDAWLRDASRQVSAAAPAGATP